MDQDRQLPPRASNVTGMSPPPGHRANELRYSLA
jgi:hypothetical protein